MGLAGLLLGSFFGGGDDTYRGLRITTLPGYDTPYYFAVGPDAKKLGSRYHFATLRQLKAHIDRLARAGKIQIAPKE